MRNKNLTVSFEEAQKIILNSVSPLESEDIPLMEASNRVLYGDIISDIKIPPVDDSAMDGYAVIADDTRGASKDNPIKLKIIGEIQAGGPIGGKEVTRGSAIRIMTGATIPGGADSVIRFEDTEEEADHVKVFREVAKNDNYRRAGENINIGDKVMRKGDCLTSANLGVLASLNCKTLKVYKQPTVSIISTGDELVDLGKEMKIGQIRNTNTYILCSEVKKYNAHPTYLGIARDTLKDMEEIFSKAMQSDIVLSTGGVSKGRYDFVREIFSHLNIEIQFERVNIKPGRPLAFGTKQNKLIFGLPGNPVPALLSFIQFVRPALLRMMGATKINKPIVNAVIDKDINSTNAYHMVRGYFTIKNNEFYVSTTGNQKPSMLRSMSDANCLIIIPENITKVQAGEKVTIQLIDHREVE